jgi:hypothetical protein
MARPDLHNEMADSGLREANPHRRNAPLLPHNSSNDLTPITPARDGSIADIRQEITKS